MYNRYVPQGQSYAKVERPESGEKKYIRAHQAAQAPKGNSGNFFPSSRWMDGVRLGKLAELLDRDKSGTMGGLVSALKLEELDPGDILLILIFLFLLVEGDDLEMMIALGLMLVLGLGSSTKKDPDDGNRPDRD